MDNSILTTIKKLLGIDESDTSFDTDILIHINSVFMILKQLGVGTESFSITGATEKWSDYLGESDDLESIKTYIYLKVKLIFDPPANSFVVDAVNKLINELEWRLNVATDSSNS